MFLQNFCFKLPAIILFQNSTKSCFPHYEIPILLDITIDAIKLKKTQSKFTHALFYGKLGITMHQPYMRQKAFWVLGAHVFVIYK